MSKDISVSTLTRWIRTLIVDAYKHLDIQSVATPSLLPLNNPHAHEVRAWAATLAFRTMPLQQLLAAAYWRSGNVFTSFYLRDVSRQKEDGTWGLPAIVAAQSSVPRSSR